MDRTRGKRLVHDMENLAALAWSALASAREAAADDPERTYALAAFNGICLAADAALRLHPESSYYVPWGRQVWNPTSLAALARTMMEACMNLHYFVVDDVSPEERQFRFIVANLHCARERADTAVALQAGRPPEPPVPEDWSGLDSHRQAELHAQLVRELPRKQVEFWEGELRRNAHFARLSSRGQARWIPGHYDKQGRYTGSRRDDGFALSRVERAERAGISGPLYHAMHRHLSSHAHVAPHALDQIRAFISADQIAIANLVDAPMFVCTKYLARATCYILGLFGDCKVDVPLELRLALSAYSEAASEAEPPPPGGGPADR